MSKIKIFLILTGYQLTWFACVLGEIILKSFIPGLVCGFFFLCIIFINSKNKKKFLYILFMITCFGYVFDSVLIFLKIYSFNTSLQIGFLPIWMLVLWPSFATLFEEVFVFLSKYKLVAVLLSSFLGPLTYYSGVPLGLIQINHYYLFILFMCIFWALLMIYYLNFLLKK